MFGLGKEDPLGDAALVKAARRRLLSELRYKREAQAASGIVNNIYGGGGGSSGGVMDRMGPPQGEDPMDYLVDITRRDLPEVNPETGKPVGWQKTVHRYRSDKKKVP